MHRTLPPGELWREGRNVATTELCSTCGVDTAALGRVVADRDRLVDELEVARAEIARLYNARVRESGAAPRAVLAPTANFTATAFAPGSAANAPFTPPPSPLNGVAASDQGIDFGAVARLSPAELDTLPYGLITLDATGRVIHYNDTESRLVGLPKERVIGRSFFGDVAPCTRVREFEGRFIELARDPVRVRVQSFDFVFRFARGEQHVSIVITPGRVRGQFHMALVRRAVGA